MAQFIWTQSDLMSLAQHKKAVVRQWACGRMKSLYGIGGTGILERLLSDKEKDVMLDALDYLSEYPEPRFKDTLLGIYTSHSGILASKSAILLGKLKDERFPAAYQKKMAAGQIESDELIGAIDALGELATEAAKTILREKLSEISRGSDSIFIGALVSALLRAGEDIPIVLNCYARHYETSGLDILYPLASVCGSSYSFEDLKEEGKRRLFRKTLPYAASDSLSHLKEMGFSSLAKDLEKAFKRRAYTEIIEVARRQAEWIVKETGVNVESARFSEATSPPWVNYRVLRSIREFVNHGPEDSLKEMALITLVILSKFIEFRNALDLRLEEMDDQSLFKAFFEDRDSLEIDDLISDRIFTNLDRNMILNCCLQQMRTHPSSFGTERALRLLEKLKDERALPDLFDLLKKDRHDASLEKCIQAMVAIGDPLVDYAERNFDRLNEPDLLKVLFALERIPVEGTVDFILRHWDRLWSLLKEPLLGVVEDVGSKKFIEPLRKELREGESLEEKVFYLLCYIHGIDDILLPRIEQTLAKRDKDVKQRIKTFETDPKALLEKSVTVELKCLQCHKPYHYDVENIFVLPEKKSHPMIGDKIVCKNCGTVNRYEITTMGQFAITSHLLLMAALANKGEKLDPEHSTVKVVEAGLIDGRRMSFDEAFEYYRKEIDRSPEDPALRVGYGNILMKRGEAEGAMFHYREALRLDPLAVEAYCSIGEHEGDRGNYPLAYEYFKKAADRMHTGHYYRTKDPDQLKVFKQSQYVPLTATRKCPLQGF